MSVFHVVNFKYFGLSIYTPLIADTLFKCRLHLCRPVLVGLWLVGYWLLPVLVGYWLFPVLVGYWLLLVLVGYWLLPVLVGYWLLMVLRLCLVLHVPNNGYVVSVQPHVLPLKLLNGFGCNLVLGFWNKDCQTNLILVRIGPVNLKFTWSSNQVSSFI